MSAFHEKSVSGECVVRSPQRYPLSIKSLVGVDKRGRKLTSPVTAIIMEADLGRYSDFGFPHTFTGKLVDVSKKKILDFAFLPEVEAIFRGSGYRFKEIEKDGTFILRRE